MKSILSAILMTLMLAGANVAQAGMGTSSGAHDGDVGSDGMGTSSGLVGDGGPANPCGTGSSTGICSESNGSLLEELLNALSK